MAMQLKGKFSGKNSLVKLFIWLGLMVVLTMLTLVTWAICVPRPDSTAALKGLQVVQTFSVFIIPALLAVVLWSNEPIRWLHMDRGFSWQLGVLVPLTIVVLSPGINLLSVLNQEVQLPSFLSHLEQVLREQEEATSALTERFARADNVPDLLLNLLIMACLPALGEEICFRGTCQGLFVHGTDGFENGRLHRQTHVAVWVTAIVFSAIHFQFYGFVPRMLLGTLLGYLLCWSGSLYLPMLAHCTNNAVAVCCFYCVEKGWVSEQTIDTIGSGDTLWLGLVSLAAGLVMLWWIRQIAVRQQSSAPLL